MEGSILQRLESESCHRDGAIFTTEYIETNDAPIAVLQRVGGFEEGEPRHDLESRCIQRARISAETQYADLWLWYLSSVVLDG